MSKATKRKHVTREVLEGDIKLTEGQSIVKVVCGRGNNLHEVESPTGQRFLVSMPTKFRRNVWIKRGDYVVIESISEGQKVQAEIVNILYQEQIKELKHQNLWPREFTESTTASGAKGGDRSQGQQETIPPSDDSDSDSDLFVNTNRSVPSSSAVDVNSHSSSESS